MAKTVLRLENVTKSYGKDIKTTVLHGLNLSIKAHSFNAIIGQSGSGKSTLLNIIGTLDHPDEGAVYLNDQRVDSLSNKALSKVRSERLGFIFQQHYLLPEFTALENVLMPYRIKHGKVTVEATNRALELLEFVGLSNVKDNLATNMSGGQQQRVAIARALMNQPAIVLADEPTGALDSESTEIVYTLLRDINKHFQTTFIIITHDKKIAERADRMIEIEDGRIILDLDLTA